MTAMMTARAHETALVLARLLEAGAKIAMRHRRDRPLVTVRVELPPAPPRWFDGGTLDSAVAEIPAWLWERKP